MPVKCPFCGFLDTKVSDTRATDGGGVIRRRRFCEQCGERFTTFERLDTIPLTVIKRNGTREAFDRSKLQRSLMSACNRRSVTLEQIETMVSEVENSFLNTMRKEIESREIGELIMDKLKATDEVSYVRFASVYKQFKNLDTFMDELSAMLKEKESSQNNNNKSN